MKIILKCIRWLIPYMLSPYGLVMLYWQLKKIPKMIKIRNYFLNLNYNEQELEIIEIIDYFRKYELPLKHKILSPCFLVFPYEFTRKYNSTDIDVFYDKSNKTRYLMHENKRLYFPNKWDVEQIQAYYNGLSVEQDKDSPHRYDTEEFSVKAGDIIADIGAAEGIWALSNIEKASKVYLFERGPIWINALQKTFEPWKDKVVIVNKYVSDISDKKNVTLDSFFNGQEVNYIKADVDGMELKVLEGSKEILKKNAGMKLLFCTYHQENDAVQIQGILEKNGFTTEYSKGYMLFIHDDNLREPYIRRGLIRAKK